MPRYVIPSKANYLREAVQALPPQSDRRPELVAGGDDPLFEHLRQDLETSTHVDIAVAFVMNSGVDLVEDYFAEILHQGGSVRLLTGDYQDFTDPQALLRLLDLDGDIHLRVFECKRSNRSFHPKAYLLSRQKGSGAAYVGSSNLTVTALQRGIEWNYRIDETGDPTGFAAVRTAFEDLFHHPDTVRATQEWIGGYRLRRRAVTLPKEPVDTEAESPLAPATPHPVQEEALEALESTRVAGNTAGLVVLATGMGKTWLSAFDSNRPEYERVLFVAHREEILDQAIKTFRRIRPTAKLGRYSGLEKTPDANALFASVQTLSRVAHLRKFARERFDYIVMDEFHHAAAATYRRILDYFEPKFVLGLTATPERSDGGDLLALCQENLVYRCDVAEGIRRRLLAPFHYFGVPDDVDYSNIPWRSNRFDEAELTNSLATQARAENALEQYRLRGGTRALGFCCSVRHADFMANFFSEKGLRAASVHSGPSSAPRAKSVEELRDGKLDILFAVDIFNEGVDLPTVDTVMMLRPTESRILWLQQFGRGLRTSEDKDQLVVIDYIGNHRTFLLKPQTLFDLGSGDNEIGRKLDQVAAGTLELPPGCQVTYELETIDILRGLLRTPKAGEALRFYYEDFVQRHGQRPTATEAFHDGYNPGSTRKGYGSWLGFVGSMGGLTEDQDRVFQRQRALLDDIETTSMTKSYKMLLLLAQMNLGALPGSSSIEPLAAEFGRLASRSQVLRADVGEALESPKSLRQHIERNPIAAWTGGKGTKRTWFRYSGNTFATTFDCQPEDQEGLQELVRELADWRLAQYLSRPALATGEGFLCRARQAGSRIVLSLPDRASAPGIPSGRTPLEADEETYEAHFSNTEVREMRLPGGSQNDLPSLLRRWFGPDAGMPGTRHEVRLTPGDDVWRAAPVQGRDRTEGPILWQRYDRAEIPGLWNLPYKPNKWRQGFLREGDHLFLLVTLEKSDMLEEHRYKDRFLSADLFEWESQNRQARHLPSGKVLAEHREQGLAVQLFVRPTRKTGPRATPFFYAGEVEFVDWEGDRPIRVRWKLHSEVPVRHRQALSVP